MTSWAHGLLEAQVAAARARGDFDHLPGRGKPLELDELAGLDAEQRLEALLLRTVGEVAPEVALIRDIRKRRATIERTAAGPERSALETALQAQIVELTATLKARRG